MTVARDLQTNPLINPPKLRNDALPLDIVQIEHFMPAIEYGIEEEQSEIDAIKNNPEPPTYKNTIAALTQCGEALSRANRIYNIFSATKSNKQLQKLSKAIDRKLTEHGNNISLDAALFARIKAVHDDPQSAFLGEEEKRYLSKLYKGYVRSGALLNEQQKTRLRVIDKKLSKLTSDFEDNTNNSRGEFKLEVALEDLGGIPQDIVDSLKKVAARKGITDKVTLSLDASVYTIIEYADNRDLREKLVAGLNNVAYANPKYDNRPKIIEIVKLRHERAQMFGYKNHAEAVLVERMAKTPETVNAFLQDNLNVYKPAAEVHLQKIRDFAATYATNPLADLKPWDIAYYERLLKQETLQVDMNEIRPYFSRENAIKALHYFADRAFGLELRPQPYPVHKKTLQVYEVFNKASGALKALFYTNYTQDTDPKNQKRGGAWMDAPRVRSVVDGVITTPIVTNDCNYPEQVEGEPPILISQRDFQTVFHEFGHGLHAILYDGEIGDLSGPDVAWDAVECPSQLLENWINDREMLRMFALHHITGEPIPDALLDKMEAIEQFGAGLSGLNQTRMGMLDMRWHTIDPADITSVEDLEREISAVAALMPLASGARSTSFTHIFSGGYSAGYYSYKWAEVMSSHVFGALFMKNGLYDRPSLEKVQKHIYADGNRHDQADEFNRLTGSKPDPQYLYEREGVLPAVTPSP